jgi:hypothetical protein
MLDRETYAPRYVRSLCVAAFAFALVRTIQTFLLSAFLHGLSRIRLSAILTIIVSEMIEVTVFMAVGWFVGYLSAPLVVLILNRTAMKHKTSYVVLGLLAGLLFLPLCAAVIFLPFRAPDLPTYMDRCAEYCAPMIIAGAVGGHAFGRIACRNKGKKYSSTDYTD